MTAENPRKSLGRQLAREWLLVNYFLWGGTALAGFFCYFQATPYGNTDWHQFWETMAQITPLFTVAPYLAYAYLRTVRLAWRISKGLQAPPEVDLDQLQSALDKVVNKIQSSDTPES